MEEFNSSLLEDNDSGSVVAVAVVIVAVFGVVVVAVES